MEKSNKCTLFFDGAATPSNPGNCSCGAVLDLPSGEEIVLSESLGWNTNNWGEYQGLILGCKKALSLGIEQLTIKGDSQLVIRQLEGQYAVKSPTLRPLYQEASALLAQFKNYNLIWIPRAQNARADAAAGLAGRENQQLFPVLPDNLPVVSPRPDLKGKIQKLMKKGDAASFKDFLDLKSGRDEFTSKKLVALEALVPLVVRDAMRSQLQPDEEDDFLARVYRWYLRGLPVVQALRKVRVSTEIASNIKKTPH